MCRHGAAPPADRVALYLRTLPKGSGLSLRNLFASLMASLLFSLFGVTSRNYFYVAGLYQSVKHMSKGTRMGVADVRDDLCIWQDKSGITRIEDLLHAYENPCQFQIELADYIAGLARAMESASSLEVGSSFGVTSALLPRNFHKSLLDYDPVALKKGAEFFSRIGQPVETINRDILRTDADSPDGRYDLVFSAGLLEHFNETERRTIIKNMAGYTKAGGYIIIGIPNHYSLPYRIAYLGLLLLGRWDYPQEQKIRNFDAEIEDLDDVVPINEALLDRNGVYSLYPAPLAGVAKCIGRLCSSEGYLKIFLFQRMG